MTQSVLEAIRRMTPWELFVDQAREGDPSQLAAILRDHGIKGDDPLPPIVWRFLADLIEGKAKVKRRKKLTIVASRDKFIREEFVARMVRHEMQEAGRQRDKNLRTALTAEWCSRLDPPLEVSAFERWRSLPKSRRKRRPTLRSKVRST